MASPQSEADPQQQQQPRPPQPAAETEPSAAQFPSLSEACRAGSLDGALEWAKRRAPARTDPESGAQDDDRPHGWYIDTADDEGRTAFHWAVAQRSFDLAKALVSAPFCCNAATADVGGATTLLSAVSAQAPIEIVNVIIEAAASTGDGGTFVNMADGASGNTALHAAASRGNRDTVRVLLAAGANPLLQSRTGFTALHRTVGRGAMSVAEDLISHVRKTDLKQVKKFVNTQDQDGNTALHHASAENNREFGEMLMRNGADRLVKNKAGEEFWQLK